MQVSLISDAYGFDILSRKNSLVRKLEVKTALVSTESRFFLSRNEFNKSQSLSETWLLYQVVFDQSVVTKQFVTADDIVLVRFIRPDILAQSVPIDRPTGKWAESAIVSMPDKDWTSVVVPKVSWSAVGFTLWLAEGNRT